ncbi:MAG TPA: hypothetical protein PKC79_14410 [Solidesulfovibrio magneticus]|nr:hypothetical protein [Solidesulfovibrio magneticus]
MKIAMARNARRQRRRARKAECSCEVIFAFVVNGTPGISCPLMCDALFDTMRSEERKLVYDAMVKGYGVTRDVVKNILKSLD